MPHVYPHVCSKQQRYPLLQIRTCCHVCVSVCVCSLARDQYESVVRQVEASAARDRRERLAACDTAARYTDVAHALWQAANLHH